MAGFSRATAMPPSPRPRPVWRAPNPRRGGELHSSPSRRRGWDADVRPHMRGIRLAERGAIVERDDRAREEGREQIVEPPAAAVKPREIHRFRFTIINGRCRAPRGPCRVANGHEITKERFATHGLAPGLRKIAQ